MSILFFLVSYSRTFVFRIQSSWDFLKLAPFKHCKHFGASPRHRKLVSWGYKPSCQIWCCVLCWCWQDSLTMIQISSRQEKNDSSWYKLNSKHKSSWTKAKAKTSGIAKRFAPSFGLSFKPFSEATQKSQAKGLNYTSDGQSEKVQSFHCPSRILQKAPNQLKGRDQIKPAKSNMKKPDKTWSNHRLLSSTRQTIIANLSFWRWLECQLVCWGIKVAQHIFLQQPEKASHCKLGHPLWKHFQTTVLWPNHLAQPRWQCQADSKRCARNRMFNAAGPLRIPA